MVQLEKIRIPSYIKIYLDSTLKEAQVEEASAAECTTQAYCTCTSSIPIASSEGEQFCQRLWENAEKIGKFKFQENKINIQIN
jgi:hypothetical protein